MRTITIGEIGEIFDGPHATPTRQRTGKFFLNISSLKSGRLDLGASDRVSDEDFEQWTRRVTPRDGDLLFSYETRLGEAALMPAGIDACLGRRMALIRPDKSIVDPRFLLYYWLSPTFQDEIAGRAVHGATVSRILLSELGKWPVQLPDFATQAAVGEVLGALDDKIVANRHLRATLRLMTTALVQAASGETESRSLASVCSTITRGFAPKYADGGLRVINQKCVRSGAVDVSQARWSASVPKSDEKLLVDADVLINSTGQGTLGRVGRWVGYGELATVDSHVSIVRVDPDLADPAFVGAVLLELEKQVEDLAEGSTGQTELRRDHLAALQLRLPDLAIQRATGDRIRIMDNRSTLARDENLLLARTRDELLPLLMSGRITVKDAERAAEDVL